MSAKLPAYLHPDYWLWKEMRARCRNPNHPDYSRYGGRGIKVCERWDRSFANFISDMGPRQPGLSIDRKDNSLGYEPGNCRWISMEAQNLNKRVQNTRYITFNGETKNIRGWAKAMGVHPTTMLRRFRTRGEQGALSLYAQRIGPLPPGEGE